MHCIGGGGVWCSATFNYWLTSTNNYAYKATTAAGAVDAGIATEVAAMSAGANDRGTCCNSKIEFTKMTGYVGAVAVLPIYADSAATVSGTPGTGSAADTGAYNVGMACVANT